MPKLRHPKRFGIVMLLAAMLPLLWWNGTIFSGKSNASPDDAISRFQDDSSQNQQRDAGSERRADREVNVESRVRSLLQIAPGEMGSIHIPASGIAKLLSEAQRRWSDDVPLVPMTREQAMHGLEEIIRHGDSLGSKVDICDEKVTWKGNGMAIDGKTLLSSQGDRHLNLTVEAAGADGSQRQSQVLVSVKGHSFFLVLSPVPDAGGVLLIFGDDAEPEE